VPRRALIPVVAVAVVVVLGGVAAYAFYFSGLRTSPAPLALSSPTPAASASAAASSTPSPATVASTVTWQVATGSLAGYRVKEQFVGQTSPHAAVARTSAVTGQVTIAQSGSSYQLTAATITVQLGSLTSVDQVAGYNVTNRDRIVSQTLDVSSFPTAVFQAKPVTLPAGADSGSTVTVSVPGTLTIHGVTKSVTASVQFRVGGGTAQVAGSISTNMTAFGISPPTVPFTSVQSAITLEFQLKLTKTA
jgi:polyisoprenoid-binding protein YceI